MGNRAIRQSGNWATQGRHRDTPRLLVLNHRAFQCRMHPPRSRPTPHLCGYTWSSKCVIHYAAHFLLENDPTQFQEWCQTHSARRSGSRLDYVGNLWKFATGEHGHSALVYRESTHQKDRDDERHLARHWPSLIHPGRRSSRVKIPRHMVVAFPKHASR
jgi:hypothetical protein